MENQEEIRLLSRETEILVLCAQTRLDAKQRERVQRLSLDGLDWDELVRMAKKHGVTSLLYRNVNAICPENVPADVFQFLRQHYQANASRAHLLADALIQIVEAAASRGITLIPFKGPTLAVMAYGNLVLRDFRDMDLIVKRKDIPDAYQIFASQSYQTLNTTQPTCEKDVSSEPYHHFVKAHGHVRVDLQSVMAAGDFSFQLDRDSIVHHLRPVKLGDAAVQCLCPEELLLILCVHGSKHVWEELKWVCDIAELIRSHQDLDWIRVVRVSQEWRCRRMLFLGLSLAQNLFDSQIPNFLTRQMTSDRMITTMTETIIHSLTDAVHTIHTNEYQAYYYCLKDRWFDRWSYGVHLCRMDAPILKRDIPWFESQHSLRRVRRVFYPVLLVLKKFKTLFLSGDAAVSEMGVS